jgi:hypothetical protein
VQVLAPVPVRPRTPPPRANPPRPVRRNLQEALEEAGRDAAHQYLSRIDRRVPPARPGVGNLHWRAAPDWALGWASIEQDNNWAPAPPLNPPALAAPPPRRELPPLDPELAMILAAPPVNFGFTL